MKRFFIYFFVAFLFLNSNSCFSMIKRKVEKEIKLRTDKPMNKEVLLSLIQQKDKENKNLKEQLAESNKRARRLRVGCLSCGTLVALQLTGFLTCLGFIFYLASITPLYHK